MWFEKDDDDDDDDAKVSRTGNNNHTFEKAGVETEKLCTIKASSRL